MSTTSSGPHFPSFASLNSKVSIQKASSKITDGKIVSVDSAELPRMSTLCGVRQTILSTLYIPYCLEAYRSIYAIILQCVLDLINSHNASSSDMRLGHHLWHYIRQRNSSIKTSQIRLVIDQGPVSVFSLQVLK